METAIGVLLGVLATFFASNYYFRRTVNKSIGAYSLLNSFVFSGIAADVRKQLKFLFHDKEVDELQQIIFLIANDGERSIRDVIEPLTLNIQNNISILDASIIHRYPEGLKVDIKARRFSSSGVVSSSIEFDFPLLNKGEFFVVKLLLSGHLSMEGMSFCILSDDLPRVIRLKQLPIASLRDAKYTFDWLLALVSCVLLLFPIWILHSASLLYKARPELFPYPWDSYFISFESFYFLIPGLLLFIIFFLVGIGGLCASLFNGELLPNRRPRFPISKELRNAVLPYRVLNLPQFFIVPSEDNKGIQEEADAG